MKYKIITAVAVSFVLGIATANAANSPQQIVNGKTMRETGDGVFKICDNHNAIYIYKDYVGGDSMAMAAVANGC